MAPLYVKYVTTLLPETLLRSISTVQTTITRHVLSPAPPRHFTVCTQARRRRRTLAASSVEELLEQAATVFMLSCRVLTLVLEEDGTVVDSEEFFGSLPANTPLMVLQSGETWTQDEMSPSFCQPRRNRLATLTFDLYKLHPKDFLCCLAVRATLCEVHSLCYDLRCSGIKPLLRCVLRCLTALTRLLGQLLLCTSSSLLQVTGDDVCSCN